MEKTYKISVIVPFFNCGEIIESCLNSILLQSYDNFEVLMIDDGSKNDSKDYALKFCKDNRFKYLYKDNSGVSDARNYGLDNVSGDYVSFVDCDDILHPDFFRVLLDLSVKNDKCITSCARKEFNDSIEWDIVTNLKTNKTEDVILNDEFSHENHWEAGVVWGKLFPISLIKNIRFDTRYHVSEDTLFFMQVLILAKHYLHIDSQMYGYRISQNSAIHGIYDQRKHTQLYAIEEISNLVKPFSYKDFVFLRGILVETCKKAVQTHNINDAILSEAIKYYRNNYQYCYSKNIIQKMLNTIFYLSPELYRLIYKYLKNQGDKLVVKPPQ